MILYDLVQWSTGGATPALLLFLQNPVDIYTQGVDLDCTRPIVFAETRMHSTGLHRIRTDLLVFNQ